MKRPLFSLQYELGRPYTEAGSDSSAKLRLQDVDDEEVRRWLGDIEELDYKSTVKYLQQRQTEGAEGIVIAPITTHTPVAMEYRLEGLQPKLLFISRPLHTVEGLDGLLEATNRLLPKEAYMVCHSMTAVLQRHLLMERYPWGVRYLVVAGYYLWHRMCPKLAFTKRLYFSVTHGKARSMNRVELLGRMYRAGFEVVDEQFRQGEFFVTVRKGSPIIHLRRIGKGGEEIVVHKFRTMYTYSEYIQGYVYQYQNLAQGGKFKDDYRINFWGHWLRRLWLDELPMAWNLLRGDIKLVGVRPLSRQYFGLYSPDMQQLRIRTKPGLLPPFYYDQHTPETLEEVQASERRYLEAYFQKPFATDWHYFWGIIWNIIFRRKRSK